MSDLAFKWPARARYASCWCWHWRGPVARSARPSFSCPRSKPWWMAAGASRIKLDTHPGQGEAGGFNYDGSTGCTGTPELCNGIDDDCDGVVDNGFNLQTDPLNCGACGIVCSAPTATTACVAGQCVISACTPATSTPTRIRSTVASAWSPTGARRSATGPTTTATGSSTTASICKTTRTTAARAGLFATPPTRLPSASRARAPSPASLATTTPTRRRATVASMRASPPRSRRGLRRHRQRLQRTHRRRRSRSGLHARGSNLLQQRGRFMPGRANDLCRRQARLRGRGTAVRRSVRRARQQLRRRHRRERSQPGQGLLRRGVAGCDPTTGVCVGECKRGAYVCTGGSWSAAAWSRRKSKSAMARTTTAMASSTTASTPTRIRTTAAGAATSAAFAHAIAACIEGRLCFRSQESRRGLRRRLGGREPQPQRRLRIPVHADGPEMCDGKDNDCNGLVDTADPGLIFPANFCLQAANAARGQAGRATRAGKPARPSRCARFRPARPPAPRRRGCATIPRPCRPHPRGKSSPRKPGATGSTTIATAWWTMPTPRCSAPRAPIPSTAVGACVRKGTWRCQADKTLPAACDFTGVAPAATPADEICDGIDNDCDGLVDESWDNPPGLTQCAGHDC
jgi:hypothetical protein